MAEVLRPTPAAPVLPSLAIKLLLTVKEAVDSTGAGESVIRAAIDSGKLKASKSGPRGAKVIKRADLEAWVRKL